MNAPKHRNQKGDEFVLPDHLQEFETQLQSLSPAPASLLQNRVASSQPNVPLIAIASCALGAAIGSIGMFFFLKAELPANVAENASPKREKDSVTKERPDGRDHSLTDSSGQLATTENTSDQTEFLPVKNSSNFAIAKGRFSAWWMQLVGEQAEPPADNFGSHPNVLGLRSYAQAESTRPNNFEAGKLVATSYGPEALDLPESSPPNTQLNQRDWMRELLDNGLL